MGMYAPPPSSPQHTLCSHVFQFHGLINGFLKRRHPSPPPPEARASYCVSGICVRQTPWATRCLQAAFCRGCGVSWAARYRMRMRPCGAAGLAAAVCRCRCIAAVPCMTRAVMFLMEPSARPGCPCVACCHVGRGGAGRRAAGRTPLVSRSAQAPAFGGCASLVLAALRRKGRQRRFEVGDGAMYATEQLANGWGRLSVPANQRVHACMHGHVQCPCEHVYSCCIPSFGAVAAMPCHARCSCLGPWALHAFVLHVCENVSSSLVAHPKV